MGDFSHCAFARESHGMRALPKKFDNQLDSWNGLHSRASEALKKRESDKERAIQKEKGDIEKREMGREKNKDWGTK